MRLLLSSSCVVLGSMALFFTVVLVLTCFGGLASPSPVPSPSALKELIEELVNITQNQVPLCNGSMVWSLNLTSSMYCAALDSLISISNCSVIQRTKRMLSALCPHKPSAKHVSSEYIRDTKIEVAQFLKDLLRHSRIVFRNESYN
ncbi:PREDICTED: interleukin-13 [Capra hircus]|nr:PREDICTED: interleukin-13 [Capra hircus]